jgi:hypothetical protein
VAAWGLLSIPVRERTFEKPVDPQNSFRGQPDPAPITDTPEPTMNRTIAIAAIALVAASSAFAESPLAGDQPFTAAKSRAEVRAELQQYKASGVNPWAQSYNQLRGVQSGKTRAQGTAEFLQSRNETAALTREDSGSEYLSARTPTDAAPVLAGQPVNAQ